MPRIQACRAARMIVVIVGFVTFNAICRAADFTWTHPSGTTVQWGTATNWNPSAGAPPVAGDAAIFNTAPAGAQRTINLGGVAREIGTLRMNETSSAAAYGFSNGSLILDRLEFNGNVFRVWNTALTAPATTNSLTLAGTGGGNIDFTASVITTGDLNINSKSSISLSGNNTITGTITLASHINPSSAAALGGGSRPIVMNTGGSMSISGPAGKYAGGVTVNGNARINVAAQPTTQPTPAKDADFGTLTITGSTLTQDYTSQSGSLLRFGETTFTGNPTFTGSGTISLGAISGGAFRLTKTGSGELILREANAYSGGTIISAGMLTAMSPTGLGSGGVILTGSGKLCFMSPQTTFPNITVPGGAALGGDLSGAVYSGPGKNVTLMTDAILFPTAGPMPVRGVDVASAQYWLAPADNNGSYVVGDAGTSPFKGIMIGYIKPSDIFAGTISEAAPGIGITAQYHSTAFDGIKAAFNTSNTTTGVTFIGPQSVRILTPFGGTASVFTFPGDPANQSKSLAQIGSSSSYTAAPEIEADETFNVSHGQISLQGQVAGTININNGGALNIFTSTLAPLTATGTFNIHDGGMIVLSGTSGMGIDVANLNYSPGAQIVLLNGGQSGTTGGTGLPDSNADLIIATTGQTPLTFRGAGLTIPDDRRLFIKAMPTAAGLNRITIGADGSVLGPPGGIHAAADADHVTIAVATGGELVVNDTISMPGVQLQTNDTTTFTTGRFNTTTSNFQRMAHAQSGSITLMGDVTAGALSHKSGALTFGVVASNANYRPGPLSVDGGSVRVNSGNLVTPSVAIAPTATLDLTDEAMVVTGQSVGSTGDDGEYDGVQGLVQAAYHFGAWDGAGGITTSMNAARNGLTTIAVATARQTVHDGEAFGGVNVAGEDVLLMYTYAGDANIDGIIDGGDYGIIDNFVQIPGADGYANGDFNYDGAIDGGDYGIIDNNIQAQGPPIQQAFASFTASGVTAVPEPATAAAILVLAAGTWLLRRRRIVV